MRQEWCRSPQWDGPVGREGGQVGSLVRQHHPRAQHSVARCHRSVSRGHRPGDRAGHAGFPREALGGTLRGPGRRGLSCEPWQQQSRRSDWEFWSWHPFQGSSLRLACQGLSPTSQGVTLLCDLAGGAERALAVSGQQPALSAAGG